jgi:hypothetical protein
MSNIIEFRKRLVPTDFSVNGVAKLDGDMSMEVPLQLPMKGQTKLQVCAITISDRIPNVFNAAPYYEFNNTIVRVSTDVVGSQRDIVLTRGLYSTVDEIADAINSAITNDITANWWLNPLNPGILIQENIITDQVIVILDPTKLKPPHVLINVDLRKSSTGTDIADTLGFSQGTALLNGVPIVSRAFYSNQEVKMDTQGTTCDVWCSLISIRRRNNAFVRTLAIVPFAGKYTTADSIWPTAGQISPELVYQGEKTIKYLTIEVKTLEGKPMLFMSGGIHAVISFIY